MKYMLVFNHDRGEYSYHPIANEAIATHTVIHQLERGRKVSSLIYFAADDDDAEDEAHTLTDGQEYHRVENALAE